MCKSITWPLLYLDLLESPLQAALPSSPLAIGLRTPFLQRPLFRSMPSPSPSAGATAPECSGYGLSAAAIGGIVVAVVMASAIVGAATYLHHLRRSARAVLEERTSAVVMPGVHADDLRIPNYPPNARKTAWPSSAQAV